MLKYANHILKYENIIYERMHKYNNICMQKEVKYYKYIENVQ